jgi:hypothetical protein
MRIQPSLIALLGVRSTLATVRSGATISTLPDLDVPFSGVTIQLPEQIGAASGRFSTTGGCYERP